MIVLDRYNGKSVLPLGSFPFQLWDSFIFCLRILHGECHVRATDVGSNGPVIGVSVGSRKANPSMAIAAVR
jgi:hypothetical protein